MAALSRNPTWLPGQLSCESSMTGAQETEKQLSWEFIFDITICETFARLQGLIEELIIKVLS